MHSNTRHTHSHSLTHSLTHSLSLCHTHTHTHTQTCQAYRKSATLAWLSITLFSVSLQMCTQHGTFPTPLSCVQQEHPTLLSWRFAESTATLAAAEGGMKSSCSVTKCKKVVSSTRSKKYSFLSLELSVCSKMSLSLFGYFSLFHFLTFAYHVIVLLSVLLVIYAK